MNYNSNNTLTAAGIIKYSCAVMFMLFCFLYIYCIQGEILAEAQFVFSKGLTTYHTVGSPLIITFVLQVVQWVIAISFKLPQKWHALSYFPSIVFLTMLADIDSTTLDSFSFDFWVWLFPLLAVIYLTVIYLIKRITIFSSFREGNRSPDIVFNHIILICFFIIAGSIPQTSDVYHYELKTERLAKEQEWEEASMVGYRSLQASQRLTELRMYALSQQGLLPEKIFDYPQYYGTKGLLDINDNDSSYRVTNDDICKHIGALCGKSVKTTKRYLELMMGNDSLRTKSTIDYYLCYFLLKKDLKGFESNLYSYYNPDKEALPRAYQEALIFSADHAGDTLSFISDDVTTRYREYRNLKAQYLDSLERSNRTRRAFGNTFWWYYDN